MKTNVLPRQTYLQQHGPIAQRNGSEETMAMWEKIKKLTVSDVMIIEPEKGENYEKLRGAWQPRLTKLAQKTGSPFKVRFALNKTDKHVVVWKEPLPNAQPRTAGARA